MKLNTKKGAALMQVLLITLILASIATMLLRANLSRTTSARKTRRTISGQILIQACMAEINNIWASKNNNAFIRDLERYADDSNAPFLYCLNNSVSSDESCHQTDRVYSHECTIPDPNDPSNPYVVRAQFEKDSDNVWRLAYEITSGSEKL